MDHRSQIDSTYQPTLSPLMLCDHLLSLAQEADQIGFVVAAGRLVDLACEVLEGPPMPRA